MKNNCGLGDRSSEPTGGGNIGQNIPSHNPLFLYRFQQILAETRSSSTTLKMDVASYSETSVQTTNQEASRPKIVDL
jgi:hypothetical protein